MATVQKQIVKMAMSSEQLEAIEVFFAHNGWDMDIVEQEEVIVPINGLLREKIELQRSLSNNSRESTPASTDSTGGNKYMEILDVKQLEFKDFLCDDDACPHCFWSPCVSTLRPSWLGLGGPPKDGNNMLRKDRYLAYVETLGAVGCWKHPAYTFKKRDALKTGEEFMWAGTKFVKEIIPQCVVELVRQLYPNVEGKTYDGEERSQFLRVDLE